MPNNPIKQHTVPNSYLLRFADSRGFTWVYDRETKELRNQPTKDTTIETYSLTFIICLGIIQASMEKSIERALSEEGSTSESNQDLVIPKAMYVAAADRFDRFCILNGLINEGSMTNEDGVLVRVADMGDSLHRSVRLTVGPIVEQEKIIPGSVNVSIEIAADDGTNFLSFKEVARFIRPERSGVSFGRQLAPRLRKGLTAARSLTSQDLSQEHLRV